MMIFSEWIRTQDPEKWDLDQASINAITQHFEFREICDDERMEVYFWRTLAKYRDRYKALLRVQSIEFDPLVNRYFEAELISKNVMNESESSNRNGNTVTNNTSNGSFIGKDVGSSVRTGNEERNILVDTNGNSSDTHTGNETTERNSDLNRTITPNITETTNINESNDESFNAYRETKGFTGRYDEKEINGSYSDRHESLKPTTEKHSGTDTTNYQMNRETEIRNNGNQTTENDSVQTGVNRNAAKAAPMSAVNIGRLGGTEGSGGTGVGTSDITDGLLGPLDFKYASQYGESNKIGKKIDRQIISYENFGTTEKTKSLDGDAESIEYGHEVKKEHDDKDTREYKNYREKTTSSGQEYLDKTGTKTNTKDGTNTVTKAGTEQTRDITSGTDIVTRDLRDKKDYNETKHETGTITSNETGNTSNDTTHTTNDQFNGNVTNIDQMSGSKQSTNNVQNRNRYTGREGLTPQDAMRRAEEYLLGYSPAFQYIIDKLEINFILVYDI